MGRTLEQESEQMITYFDYVDEPRVICCDCGHIAILKYCEYVETGSKPRQYRCVECARQRKDKLRKW